MTNSPIIYSASADFDRKKITRLTRVQFYSRAMWRTAVTVLCAAALIVIGVTRQGGFLPMLALAVGAFLVISLFSRESSLSNKIIERYNGDYPMVFYYFSDDGIRGSRTKETIPYSDLDMLIEDKNALFIFRRDGSALMADKPSVGGEGETEGLKAFLSGKTGISWRKTSALLLISINKSLHDWRTKTEKDNYSGERLG